MTEAEWLGCDSPRAMLAYLRRGAEPRKVRLFAIAGFRRALSVPPARSRPGDADAWGRAFELGEQLADGLTDPSRVYSRDFGGTHHTTRIAVMLSYLAGRDVIAAALTAFTWAVGEEMLERASGKRDVYYRRPDEVLAQARLLRDVFGNPFRPVAFSPSWRTDTALILAREMYESREFSAMPILADALQDAGCDNDDILSHCRDVNQPHVRGCWVTDLVLNKV